MPIGSIRRASVLETRSARFRQRDRKLVPLLIPLPTAHHGHRLHLAAHLTPRMSDLDSRRATAAAPAQARVCIYTLAGCVHCQRARALLQRRAIEFTEIRGDGKRGFRHRLRDLTGGATVPQITIDEVPVGGASDLARLDRRGVLLPLIQRESFPRAVVGRRLIPAAILTAPVRSTQTIWRHRIDIVARNGQRLERVHAGSADEAVALAEAFNQKHHSA